MIVLLFIFSIDPRYHTLSEIGYELDSLATHYPTIVALDTIGYSTNDSLPIFAAKVSDNPKLEEDEPAILYVGCHHAEEILGVELCMYMIHDLVSKYNNDSLVATYWINNREIWFVPLINPEGREVVMSGVDTIWRKNKHDNNNNGVFDLDYDGVDLNRNYDFYWPQGGSLNPPDEYYRGSAPFSEKEIQALRDLALAQHFVFGNSYHSARTGLAEVVYYPWSWAGGYPPDYIFIREVADTMSKRIVNDQGNGHYTALVGTGLDGNERNWFYGVTGTFAYTVEMSTTTIQPGWMVDGICQRNMVGAYYFLERVSGSGITGCISDSVTGEPLCAEVIINGRYDPTLPKRQSEPNFGRFLRILAPGTYDLEVHKYGYVTKSYSNVLVNGGVMTQLNIQLSKMVYESVVENAENKIIVSANPSRNAVIIHLNNAQDFSSLKIFDINGRLLKEYSSPSNDLVWQCNDNQNRKIANGIYLILGETTQQKLLKKVIVLN